MKCYEWLDYVNKALGGTSLHYIIMQNYDNIHCQLLLYSEKQNRKKKEYGFNIIQTL